jgi:hypothetical protein
LIESLERHAAKIDRGESVVSSTVDHVREQGHGGELNVCDRWKNPGKHGKRVTRLREKAQMEEECSHHQSTTTHKKHDHIGSTIFDLSHHSL